jgi:hypothetical protein
MSKDAQQTDQNAAATEGDDSPLISKLKAQKAQKTGMNSTVLPETGVTVTWPKFQSHADWMKAQRLAKKDLSRATNYYLVGICKFEGEKMSMSEFVELMPSGDIFHLMSEVMGDDESEEDAGNVLH